MTVDIGDQGPERMVGELPVRTAPSFDVFYGQHQELWVRYAHAQTGSWEAAEQITDAITLHMHETWHRVHRPEEAALHAWKALKATVARWLDEHDRESAFAETGAFERVTRLLERQRERFAAMEESVGLYSAISRLRGRQYDSIVLKFVLEYSNSRIAALLGVKECTVRSNLRNAKKRLAEELGLPYVIGNEA